MIDSIQRIKNYTVGWCGDNYYSVPASENTINDALLFINNLSNNMNCKPIISLATDGEICFVWKTKDYVLDLGFYGDGTYSYYGKEYYKKKELCCDSVLINSDLPFELLKLITE